MKTLLNTAFFDPRFRYLRYRAAILLYAMVLLLGSIPGAREEVGTIATGLVLHSVTYAVLTLLLYTGGIGTAVLRAAKSLITIMAMGALDELVQSFFPYRTASIRDWLVDCIAGLVVSLALMLVFSRQMNHAADDLAAK